MTPPLALTAAYIAGAIVLDATALTVWNIGTRSPARLLADLRRGLSERSVIAHGLVRFATGSTALVAGAVLCASVAKRSADFSIVECGALVTALLLEGLIGPDVRGRSAGVATARRRSERR